MWRSGAWGVLVMTGAIEGYRSPSACTDPQIPRQDGCVLFNTFFFFFFWCGFCNSQVALVVNDLPGNAEYIRNTGWIPGSRRSPEGGHANPLQFPCLETPMDRGAWPAVVHRVMKSRSWLKQLGTHACAIGVLESKSGQIFFYKGPHSTYFWLWSLLQLVLSAQLCPVLCDPLECLLPDSTILGILQARTLEWVVISSSRGSSQPRDQTQVSCISWISRWILYHWDT